MSLEIAALPGVMMPRAARDLLTVLGIALAARLVFFTGFFGSDEVLYVMSGFKALHGEWPVADYVGGTRYGVNLPIAASMWLFGVNEASAALWSLLASIVEVGVVYLAGREMVGRRAAMIAAVLLALLPIHAHLAGRLMADSPLALFITLAFVMFWKAERSRRADMYVLAGLSAGAVFWIKESVTVFLLAFLAYPLVFRRFDVRWLWMAFGSAVMVTANCILFWGITGDPLHVFRIAAASAAQFAGSSHADSPLFYPRYLLLDLRHTWLLGWFALMGLVVVAVAHRRRPDAVAADGAAYVVFWALSLMSIFTFLVISLEPLRLLMKQTNYMTIFLAPLALLGGLGLAAVGAAARRAGLAIFVAGAVPLLALEQLTIESFAANSKAALTYAMEHPDARIFGLQNAEMASVYYERIFARGDLASAPLISPLRFAPGLSAEGRDGSGHLQPIAVLDLHTLGWGRDAVSSVHELPECWRRIGRLEPQLSPVAGITAVVVRASVHAMNWLTGSAPASLRSLVDIRPAYLYSAKAC